MENQFLDLKEYVPPFNTLVVTKDRNGVKSVGRITKIEMAHKSDDPEPGIKYTWHSYKPYVHEPTHWMHLPK